MCVPGWPDSVLAGLCSPTQSTTTAGHSARPEAGPPDDPCRHLSRQATGEPVVDAVLGLTMHSGAAGCPANHSTSYQRSANFANPSSGNCPAACLQMGSPSTFASWRTWSLQHPGYRTCWQIPMPRKRNMHDLLQRQRLLGGVCGVQNFRGQLHGVPGVVL